MTVALEPTEGDGSAKDTPDEQLWIEQIAETARFDRVAETIFGDRRFGVYLLVASLIVFDLVVVGYFAYLETGFFVLTENPIGLLLLPGWLFAVWAARRLKHKYHTVVDALPAPDPVVAGERTGDSRADRLLKAVGVPYDQDGISETAFDRTIPVRLRIAVFVGALIYHVSWVAYSYTFAPANFAFMLENWGLEILILRQGLLIPFGYYLIAAELVSMLLAVHVVLPIEVQASARIDFQDPLGYAGLRPVGNLIKWSTVYYAVGLTAYATFFTFSVGVRNTTLATTMTLVGTGLALVLFVAPVYYLHRYMKAAIETKIEDIADTVRSVGPSDDDRMFPDTTVENPDHADVYTHEFIRLQKVEATAEYPIDVAILQETVLILVLPYLAHVSSIFVFEHLHI